MKFINSLRQKKNRHKHGLFIIEGEKMVDELLESRMSVHSLYATAEWFRKYSLIPDKQKLPENFPVYEINNSELARISGLSQPNKVLAIVSVPVFDPKIGGQGDKLILVLDNISDPGNLGTLIRSADWFGIEDIVCSNNSAEFTNPKVVQSTMGSVLRVKVHYKNLPEFLSSPEITGMPVIGAFLEGPAIYSQQLPDSGLIVLGNESAGITPETEKYITQRISIPSFHHGKHTAESLNIAVAGSIILSEFKRRTLKNR